MTATDTGTVPGRRRVDAGTVRLIQRDITGLVLCAEPTGCAASCPDGVPPGTPKPAGTHRPDAEIWWPSITASPHAGQIWAIEIELTAKHADRTAAIMAELTTPAGYAHVYYLTAPAARGVVARCAAALPGDAPARLTVGDLPPAARTPGT